MDVSIFNEVDKQLPKFNRALAEGMAVSQLTTMQPLSINGNIRIGTINEQYINELWTLASKSFPPNLKYVGYRRVTPEEEFQIVSNRKRNGKRYYDITRSDFYLVCYQFTLDGQPLPDVPLYLPFVSLGGIITIKNAKFMINPVMADLGLSVSNDGIFLMMNRAKLTFDKIVVSMIVNGGRESTYVVWSQVYNIKDKRTNKTTLAHYLFCKYGVIDTLKRFNCNAFVMSRDEYYQRINEFPESEYKICQAAGRSSRGIGKNLIKSNAVIIVRNSEWCFAVQSVISAFFYVADIFPDKITADDYDSPILWRRLLGKLILGMHESEVKNINQINTHMASVDGYIDAMVTKWLADGGYPGITNIYELFQLLIDVAPAVIAKRSESVSSLYGKRYVLNRYVNTDIVSGISNFFFAVQKCINSGKILKPVEVSKMFNKYLNYTLAMKINRDHSEVKSVSSASDCLIHKITSVTLLQTDASTSNANGPRFDSSKVLDISIAEVGGVSNQPSRDPSGRSSINMCVQTDNMFTIVQAPETADLLNGYQLMIKR